MRVPEVLRPWVLRLDYSDEPPFGADEVYDYTLVDPDGKLVDSLTFCGLTTGYLQSMVNAHLPQHGLSLLRMIGTAMPDLTADSEPPFNAFADYDEGIRWMQQPDQHEFMARCVAKRKNKELDFDSMPNFVLRDWFIDNGLEEYADLAYKDGDSYGDKKCPATIRVECRRWYSQTQGWLHTTSVEVGNGNWRDSLNSSIRCGGDRYQMLATAASSITQHGWSIPELFPLQPDNACKQSRIEYEEFIYDVRRKKDL